jgi:hypothetical protein
LTDESSAATIELSQSQNHTLNFSDSSTSTWGTLTIKGWLGDYIAKNADGTTKGRIYIGNTADGLTDTQKEKIFFIKPGTTQRYTAMLTSDGELVPDLLVADYELSESGVRALPPGTAEANNTDFVTLEALIRDANKIGVAGQTVTFEATTTPGNVTFCPEVAGCTTETPGNTLTCVTDDGNGGLPKGACRVKVKGDTTGSYETKVRLGTNEYLAISPVWVGEKQYGPSPVQYSFGRSIAGTVFIDNGGGDDSKAYDGEKEPDEKALPGVAVKVTSSDGATTYSAATTAADGSYRLSIAEVAPLTPVKVVVTPPPGYKMVSTDKSTTGGDVDLPAGTLSFILPALLNTSYVGVDFGMVRKTLLLNDTFQNAAPNMPVFHPIRYDAYAAVETTFSLDVSALPQGWTAVLVRDDTCKGNDGTVLATAASPNHTEELDGGVTTGGVPPHLCMAIKVTPHAGAPDGSSGLVKVTVRTKFKFSANDSGQIEIRHITATTTVAQRFVLIKSALKYVEDPLNLIQAHGCGRMPRKPHPARRLSMSWNSGIPPPIR